MGNKPTIHAHIENLYPHGTDKVDLVVYVTEKDRGRITATELYKYLSQDDKRRLLEQQLQCQRVVPRLGASKEELKGYLKNPPFGFDPTDWAHAVSDNPDPERLVPHPVRGFDELIARQRLQTTLQSQQARALDEITRRMEQVHSTVLAADARQAVSKQRQKQISHRHFSLSNLRLYFSFRLLRVLTTQTLIQRFGMAVDEDEDKLASHLEQIDAGMNAPEQIKVVSEGTID